MQQQSAEDEDGEDERVIFMDSDGESDDVKFMTYDDDDDDTIEPSGKRRNSRTFILEKFRETVVAWWERCLLDLRSRVLVFHYLQKHRYYSSEKLKNVQTYLLIELRCRKRC